MTPGSLLIRDSSIATRMDVRQIRGKLNDHDLHTKTEPTRAAPGRRYGHLIHSAAQRVCDSMNTATILVVDDEPQLRRAMRATLADLGYSVIEARTGEEALEMLDHVHGGGAPVRCW